MLRISRPVAVSLAEYVNVGISRPSTRKIHALSKALQTRLKSPFDIVLNMGKNDIESQHVHFQMIALSIFDKKKVAKCPGFSYFHCQLHRMVPGQTGVCLEAREARNKKH
jgi:hypothetical protein